MRKLYPRTMLAICLALVLALGFSIRLNAQSAANYAVSSTSTGSLVLDANSNAVDMTTGTTQLIAGSVDDGASAVNNIGFDFYFMGVRYTQFSASSNGLIRLGGTAISNTNYNITSTASNAIIAPFGADMETSSTGKVHFKMAGTAPNRCLVVEFLNMGLDYTGSYLNPDGTYQARLYENGNIEFVYGGMNVNSSTVNTGAFNIGFSTGTATANTFLCINNTATNASSTTTYTAVTPTRPASGTSPIADLTSAADGSRKTYLFTPAATTVPSGVNFTGVTATSFNLNWTDNASDELGYVILRSTDNINFTYLTTTAANANTLAQTGLTAGGTYYYRIYALRESLGAAATGSQATNAGTLSGTKTVGSGGDYTNLTTAFAAINTNGLGGNVELQLITGYPAAPETYPILTSTAGAAAGFTIKVYPTVSGLSITSASTTGTLKFDNGANITFDGRVNAAGSAKDLTIENTVAGGYAIQFINDASSNVIKYATVKGVTTSTTSGVIFFSTTTGTTGNDNNTIDNCDIRDGLTTPANAIYSAGTTTTAALNNSGNTVSNSNIYNFFAAGTASNGVFLSSGNTDWTLTGNSFYQTATRTSTAGSTHTAITVSNTGNNFIVSNNIIGGGNSTAGGTAWTVAGAFANRFVGIQLSVGTTAASSLQNNVIKNFSWSSTSGATAEPGVWAGLSLAGSINAGSVTGNSIGDATTTGSISVTSSTTGAISYGVVISGGTGSTVNFSNNIIGSITVLGSAATVGHSFRAISNTTSGIINITNNIIGSGTIANSINLSTATGTTIVQEFTGIRNTSSLPILTISGNTIANINNATTSTSASSLTRGIISSAGVATISANTIRNMTSASAGTATGSTASVQGIVYTSTTAGNHIISDNVIHSLFNTSAAAAVNMVGIYYAGPSAGTNLVSKNSIHSLSVVSTSATANITGISAGGGIANFQNNVIRLGINPGGTALTNGIVMVGIDKSTATNNNFYHNSVYIGGAGVATSAANTFAFRRTSTGTDIVQNNIFVNQRSNAAGTAKHYVISINANTTLNNGFNVYYGAGTGFVFGVINTTDYSTLALFKGASGTDAGSAFGDPQFLNPTGTSVTVDLHIHATNPTPVEGLGTLIASVTDDIDGSVRSGLTPVDIGADAGNFVQLDIAGPAITYTALAVTGCNTDRTVSATITDPSGVNVTAGTKPRLYFKRSGDLDTYNDNTSGTAGWKYVEATNATSPFTFTTNFSLLSGGTGVSGGQTVQYFVVAQDLSSSVNVSINSGSFNTAPTSVALTATAFPISTPNSYSVVGVINSDVTIGATGTYTSLTGPGGLFAAINGGGINGNINAVIMDAAVTETGANALNTMLFGCSGTGTLTIKPNTGVGATLTGTNAAALIKLNGADNVVFDGLNTGGSSLTITNTNTGTTSAVIWLSSPTGSDGATNNTIRNCRIVGNASTTTLAGIFSGGTSISTTGNALAANSNNTIQNNTISKSQVGILAIGTSTTTLDNNLVIQNNNIGTSVAGDGFAISGVAVYLQNNATISGNDIQNITNTGSLGLTDAAAQTINVGLYARNCPNVTISRNQVHNINIGGSSVIRNYSISIEAPLFNVVATPSNAIVHTNLVYDVRYSGTGSSTWQHSGINDNGGYGDKFYYNTVYLTGAFTTTSGPSAAFSNGNAGNTAAASMIDVRNNIFSANISAAGASSVFYGHYDRLTAATIVGSTINYNNLKVATASGTANVGLLNTTAQGTLAAWQTATGMEANSSSADPLLNSNTNLKPQIGSPVVGAGTTIAGIVTDFLGSTRNAPPTIGAYENALDAAGPVITYTALTNTLCTTNRTLTATITDAGSGVNVAPGTKPRIWFKKSTNSNVLATNDNTTDGWKYVEASNAVSPFTFTIDYSMVFGGVTTGETIQYFIAAQDVAAVPNVTINSGTATGTVTSVALAGGNFPISGTINSYTIPATGLNTDVTIGASGTYTTLTGAGGLFSALNSGGLLGNVTAFIQDPTVAETGVTALTAMSYGCGGPYTLTIKPAPGVTTVLSGSATTPLVVLNGASNVVIDGSNSVGGTSRDLTVLNTGTSANSGSLFVVGSNVTTKNIIAMNADSSYGFGIVYSAASNGIIQNNEVKKAVLGIQTQSNSTNISITGNIIGSPLTNNGILSQGISILSTSNFTVTGNQILGVKRSTTGNIAGISVGQTTGLSLPSDGTISNNIIQNVRHLGYNSSSYAAHGILLQSNNPTSNILVSNNFVSEIASEGDGSGTTNGTPYVAHGIYVASGGGYNIYYNSVYLTSVISDPDATALRSGALTVENGTGVGNLNVRNNILSNLGTFVVGGSVRKAYAIISNAPSTVFSSINNNAYYVSGPDGMLGFIGAADKADLASIQAGFGGNTASVVASPNFVSSLDLHLTGDNNCAFDGAGVALSVTTDIDGDARNATTPDIGADEFNNTFNLTITNPAAVCTGSTVNLTAAAVTAGSTGGDPLSYWTDAAATSTLATPAAVGTAGTYYIKLTKGSCSAVKPVTVGISPATVGGSVAGAQTICSGTQPTTDLVLSGQVGSVQGWESSPNASFAIASPISSTATTLTGATIGNLTQNTYFRAVVKSGACNVDYSASVLVTVNPTPTVTSAATGTICSNVAANYTITSGVSGATFTWSRAAVTGVVNGAVTGQTGNPITESLINTSSAPVDVTYAIVPSASGCTGPSFNYVVTVNPTPAMTSAAAGTICSGVAQNYTLTSNVSGATFSWSRAAVVGISNTALTGQSSNPITEALVNTTSAPVDVTYALTPTANGCSGATFNYVVTVNAASVGGTVASPQTVCIGSAPSSSIVLSGNTGSVVKWQKSSDAAFTSPNDINITSATLSNISMGQLTQNTYFRAVVQSASCAAANSASVLMTVNSTVDNTTALAGTAGGGQVCATYDVAASNNYMNNCNLIATVAPRAGTPISGVVNACVMVEAGVLTAPNGQPYVARHFDILPATNRTTATSTMTLYFKQAEFTAYNAARGVYPALPTGSGDATGIANLRVTLFNTNGVGTSFATYPALSGKAIVPTSVTYNATADRWSVVFDATGSGAVYVHTGAFALPVTLVSFKGEQSGEINKLTWSTAIETNNKGFELERSLDGIKFTSIAFVASKGDNGNSSVNLDYGYNDKAVVGVTYYRLKQVDRDGKYNYSNVVTLTRKGSEIVLSSVYPNPATSELNLKITSPRAENLTIVVTDLTGKVVMQRAASVATGDNIATMNVSALAAGSYIIKAVCANGCETAVHKFVKQ